MRKIWHFSDKFDQHLSLYWGAVKQKLQTRPGYWFSITHLPPNSKVNPKSEVIATAFTWFLANIFFCISSRCMTCWSSPCSCVNRLFSSLRRSISSLCSNSCSCFCRAARSSAFNCATWTWTVGQYWFFCPNLCSYNIAHSTECHKRNVRLFWTCSDEFSGLWSWWFFDYPI